MKKQEHGQLQTAKKLTNYGEDQMPNKIHIQRYERNYRMKEETNYQKAIINELREINCGQAQGVTNNSCRKGGGYPSQIRDIKYAHQHL